MSCGPYGLPELFAVGGHKAGMMQQVGRFLDTVYRKSMGHVFSF